MFQGNFDDVSLKFHEGGSFIDVSRVFHDFQGCFQSVSKKFQENFQGVSKKFHVAWHSSQLPPSRSRACFFEGVARMQSNNQSFHRARFEV